MGLAPHPNSIKLHPFGEARAFEAIASEGIAFEAIGKAHQPERQTVSA